MIALRDRTSLQRYQPAVMRHNALVIEHTERCVGRILNTLVVDQVSRNLVWPSPDRP